MASFQDLVNKYGQKLISAGNLLSAPFRAGGELLGRATLPAVKTIIQGAPSVQKVGEYTSPLGVTQNLLSRIPGSKIKAPAKPTFKEVGTAMKTGLTGAGLVLGGPKFLGTAGLFGTGLNTLGNVSSKQPILKG